MNALLEDLDWRGLVHQATSPDALAQHLATPRSVYSGFDPTGDSLTIGNLVPLLTLVRFQRAGHKPYALLGGGTGMIGDPSGKESERQLLTLEAVSANVEALRPIFEALLDFSGPSGAALVNNADWLTRLGYVELLRDVGKHFSVNMMIQKDSVRQRLSEREQGISYTEFSYMILQAYDFRHLHVHDGVTVQVGGSDQWGNIVAGVDLVRRMDQAEVFGLTNPLVTKADGSKFGKTESGAIWLSEKRTSAYAFYQFWLRTNDADVPRYLKLFTLLPRAEIEELIAAHETNPGARTAHRELGRHVTALLHGPDGLSRAEAASNALFSGEVRGLDLGTLAELFENTPSTEHALASLDADGQDLVDLLVEANVVKSKREARQLLESGAISVNGERASTGFCLTRTQLLHDRIALIRRGKKSWHVTRWS